MKLGEEIILTLLWQSGASESATVCFVRLRICCWLFKCGVWCVVCVCVRERETGSHITVGSTILIAAWVQTHTSFITVSVTRLCSSFGLELMLKLRTLLSVFTLVLKAEACDYGKGSNISDSCLWCSANHNALGQLANQSRLCLLEGGAL